MTRYRYEMPLSRFFLKTRKHGVTLAHNPRNTARVKFTEYVFPENYSIVILDVTHIQVLLLLRNANVCTHKDPYVLSGVSL